MDDERAKVVKRKIRERVPQEDSSEVVGVENPIRARMLQLTDWFLSDLHLTCTNNKLYTTSDDALMKFVAKFCARKRSLPIVWRRSPWTY